MSSDLALPFLISTLLHWVGLTVLAMLGSSLWALSPPSHLITTELIVAPSPPAPVTPVPPPAMAEISPPKLTVPAESLHVVSPPALRPQPMVPPRLEQMTPPRLVARTPSKQAVAPVHKTPVPKPQEFPLGTPGGAGDNEKPRPGPPLPLPLENPPAAAGNVLGPPAMTPPDRPFQAAEGAAAGDGSLFERGDASVVPGDEAGGGAGGAGRVGFGTGGLGGSTPVAGLQPGVGGEGAGGGTGPLARPLGGYQVKPRYPESARRQGIEGTTVLKIHVSDKGRVVDVLVERSAGQQDLDLAAIEAVKKWRFEPARRGQQAVAVWVMLPVRFELR